METAVTRVIREAVEADFDAVAHLIHFSTNSWYQANRGQIIFDCPPEECRLFPETYATLAGSTLLLVEDDGVLAASCFLHERATHFSLGILNSHPAFAGKGAAKSLVLEAIRRAKEWNKPLHLVSSLMNLDSFSLYSRLGFAPCTPFQDMILTVPETGLAVTRPEFGGIIRSASAEDANEITAMERRIVGIERPQDWHHFIQNRQGIWKVFVATDGDGVFLGALAGHRHPASSLTGPGIATNEETMSALIWQALDMQRGKTTVFLVPAMARKLVAFAYRLGARNCELHISQCVSADSDRMPLWQNPKGVAMPTFLPESF